MNHANQATTPERTPGAAFNPPGRALLRGSDAALALLLISIVAMLIVPLPTWLLDLLIAGNLALSVLVLVTAMYVPHGLAFSAMPTLLLITTLYRLALNVSSTRLILLQADAGRVISAFGDFVVRGNYVVGAVVFLILTIIQYLVIAKGGERVAEVGARFTLDAMPGKQLAIDADLRSGALSVEAARVRRRELERESQFYGAMDGAMKFVKGDAIAGIAIAVVSLLGGTAIGVGMRGLTFVQSLRTYGLLTIGDGLVSQIPALVISTGAGLVVTRVATHEHDGSLGEDIAQQLFHNPRVLGAAALFLALLGVVPGLPTAPFFVLAAVLGVSARTRFVQERAASALRTQQTGASDARPLLRIELGAKLAQRVHAAGAERALQELISRCNTALQSRLGVGVPTATIGSLRDADDDEGSYAVVLDELAILRGQADSETRLLSELAADLPELLTRRASELLGIDDVKRMLDTLEAQSPALVRSVLPKPVSLQLLTSVLHGLLDEGVNIRPLARILQALAVSGPEAADQGTLIERARHALREPIVQRHEQAGVLNVHRIDPLIEDAVRDAVQHSGSERYLALPPDMARDIVASVRRIAGKHTSAPVLVTQPDLRRFVRELLAPELPAATVLSYTELAASRAVEEREPIAL